MLKVLHNNCIFLFILLGLLGGCSSGGHKTRFELQESIRSKDFNKALSTLESSELKKDERSRLLYHLEKGLIYHAKGDYYQSLEALDKASDIARDLYTTRVSGKLASAIVNDSSDVYYAPLYERSVLYFYLALNHYLLSQKGIYEAHSKVDSSGNVTEVPERVLSAQEKTQELRRARASVVAWDSMMKSNKDDLLGKSVFKFDLLAKVFGGFIHEAQNSLPDDQVALQLYKDGLKVLFRNYNGYAPFNDKHTDFQKNFSQFHQLNEGDIAGKYVKSTAYQKQLKEFLQYKILELTRKARPTDLSKEIKALGASEAVQKKLERLKAENNVSLVLEWDTIPAIEAKRINIGLEGLANEASSDGKTKKIIMEVGTQVLMAFAINKLGLYPDPAHANLGGVVLGTAMGAVTAQMAAIQFEIPRINPPKTNEEIEVEVTDKNNKVVARDSLKLVNPLGDMASEIMEYEAIGRYFRIGSRVVMKHMAAIALAYVTYDRLKGKNNSNDFLARNAALAEYLLLARGIDSSEKADVRSWSTLPRDIRLTQFSLPVGEYKARALVKRAGEEREQSIDLGNFKVSSTKEMLLLDYRP